MASPSTSAQRLPLAPGRDERDVRADVLRGIALLCVLWNHTFLLLGERAPSFLQITPRYWGISSAAEMFVFLSGCVYGAVYLRLTVREGVAATYAKSLTRAWQLYVASALTVLIVLAIMSYWHTYGAGAGELTAARLRLDRYLVPSTDLFWNLATLRRMPAGFDILSLYIVLLLVAPLYLMLLRKDWRLVLLVGLVPYLIVQLGVPIPYNRFGTGWWYFNPLAWQLLFLLGILASSRSLPLPRGQWAIRMAGLLVLAVGVQMWALKRLGVTIGWLEQHDVPALSAAGLYLRGLRDFSYPLAGVSDLEPVRLVYFCVLAFAVAAVTHPRDRIWTARAARPIALLGRTSLEVFCFGTIYVYAAVALRPSLPAGWPATLTIILIGFGASVLFAHVVQLKRRFVLAGRAVRGSVGAPAGARARELPEPESIPPRMDDALPVRPHQPYSNPA